MSMSLLKVTACGFALWVGSLKGKKRGGQGKFVPGSLSRMRLAQDLGLAKKETSAIEHRLSQMEGGD